MLEVFRKGLTVLQRTGRIRNIRSYFITTLPRGVYMLRPSTQTEFFFHNCRTDSSLDVFT